MANNNNKGKNINNNLNNSVYPMCGTFTHLGFTLLGFKRRSVTCPKSLGNGGETELESGRPQSLHFGNCVK